jgi:hypothetical protein
MLNACETLEPVVSVTWTVKLKVPRTVGVPDIWAEVLVLDDRKVRPGGIVPEITDQVNGVDAPVAFTKALYGTD